MLTRKDIPYKQVNLFRLQVFKEGSSHLVMDLYSVLWISLDICWTAQEVFDFLTLHVTAVCLPKIFFVREVAKLFSVCLLKLHGTKMPTVRKWNKEIGVNVITLSYLVQQLENTFHQAVAGQWFILSKMVNIGFWLKHEASVLWSSLHSARANVSGTPEKVNYFRLGWLPGPCVGKLCQRVFGSVCGTLSIPAVHHYLQIYLQAIF